MLERSKICDNYRTLIQMIAINARTIHLPINRSRRLQSGSRSRIYVATYLQRSFARQHSFHRYVRPNHGTSRMQSRIICKTWCMPHCDISIRRPVIISMRHSPRCACAVRDRISAPRDRSGRWIKCFSWRAHISPSGASYGYIKMDVRYHV